jgi:hypothetical protein
MLVPTAGAFGRSQLAANACGGGKLVVNVVHQRGWRRGAVAAPVGRAQVSGTCDDGVVSEKLPPDEIDGDFCSLTLSLSTPLPPLQDKAPVSKSIVHAVSNVADSGDREVKYEDFFPKRPKYSGALFPRKPRAS